MLNKKNLILATAVIGFLLFHIPILDLFDTLFVLPIFSKIQATPFSFIVLFLLCQSTVIISFYLLREGIKVRKDLLIALIFIGLVYAYYRFFGNRYSFIRPSYAKEIAIADILLFITLAMLAIKVSEFLRKQTPPFYFASPFLIDRPIANSGGDRFGRKHYAQHLAEKIMSKLEPENCGSLAIGINGEWGSGKSSYMNLIKEHILTRSENRIMIDFNPWRSTTAARIIEDFFEVLIAHLQAYDSDLSKNIAAYAKTITEIDDNFFSKSFKAGTDFIYGQEDRSTYYDKINRSIALSQKQLIIFIDDLDRLDKLEIIEVLRLIRNSANFNSVVYVVSYDRGYIEAAIKDFNEHNSGQFLEKIFQFEFQLPKYDLAILRTALKETLLENLLQLDDPAIESAVEYTSKDGTCFTNQILQNHRDVVRLANAILYEHEFFKGEVNFVDFYLIQLLKLKHYSIYEEIAKNTEVFFILDDNKLRLRKKDEQSHLEKSIAAMLGDEHPAPSMKKEKKEQDDTTILYEILYSGKLGHLGKIKLNYVFELLQELFVEKEYRSGAQGKDFKSFSFGKNYQKYFNLEQLQTDFSFTEFEQIRTGPFQEYEAKILSYIEEGRLSDVFDRLAKIADFTSYQEWLNHLEILLFIGRYEYKQKGYGHGTNVGPLLRSLSYPQQNKKWTFFKTEKAYHQFVADLFKNAPSPYTFESYFLKIAIDDSVNFALTDQEIADQLLTYLKSYANAAKENTGELYALYSQTVHKTENYADRYPIQPQATEIFQRNYQKHLNPCDCGEFIQQLRMNLNKFQLQQDWVEVVFGSNESFERYVERTRNTFKQNSCAKELYEFYLKLKANNMLAIDFDFKHLKPATYQ